MRDNRPLFWISLAVFLWGLVLAAGVWLFGADDTNRLARPVIIILFVDGFLGLWLLALFVRRRS
ncbi:MAG: hypothetical protein MPJ50_06335 [Pirellulales bacterium]|nr:hypothetical protein [Pirellulales bacterium]